MNVRSNLKRLAWPIAGSALVVALASFTIPSLVRRNKPQPAYPTHNASGLSMRHVPHAPNLTIEKIVQHGHIVEIDAAVDPGTTVMVNGEKAAVIWGEGEFRHFVGPLPDGVNNIAITVQNEDGGINSKQLSVVMP
jgi:hypothetical protein